ncbi:unnamed protein product [Ectocarpus sp. 12 AP-2014]
MQAGEGEGESDSMFVNRPPPRGAFSAPSRTGALGGSGAGGGAVRSKWTILLVVLLIVAGIFVIPRFAGGGGGKLRGSTASSLAEGGPFKPDTWDILLISDLDKKSKVDDKGKQYRSVLQAATITRDPATKKFSTEFGEAIDLFSGHNEAGRGMELSELINYRGSLLTVDDRTGIVFEIVEEQGERHMAPRYILPEGDGNLDKGMKLEWATEKDGSLVVGSFGKEYTDNDGRIVNTNNNWIITIDPEGVISRQDWTKQYNTLRDKVGATFPGYMIHESAAWSDALNKWVFLPRRISSEKYDDVRDEKMGSNTILIVDEDFRKVDVRHVGDIVETHGFSSFKFVPGTGDQVVVALKSEEIEELQTQTTFIMVFTLDGEVLLEETEIPGGFKFEGLEIFPIPASRADVAVAKGGNR